MDLPACRAGPFTHLKPQFIQHVATGRAALAAREEAVHGYHRFSVLMGISRLSSRQKYRVADIEDMAGGNRRNLGPDAMLLGVKSPA
jgi:hypothetical protein